VSLLKGIRPAVVLLGLASLLNDAASEMIYPLLPVYLSAQLGASAFVIGMIEAIADGLASVLKWLSGRWSDRLGRRKPFVVSGYAIAAASRVLIAAATSWVQVFVARLADRTGKGLRSAPRDALIAEASDPAYRGKAFGFHRAMDHAGAIVGPLVGSLLVGVLLFPLKTVFYVAVVPGLLASLLLIVFLRDETRVSAPAVRAGEPHRLPVEMRGTLRAIGVFSLANSSDAFLLLHAHLVGIETYWLPLLWAAHHVVKSALSTAGGALSDRFDRRYVLATGWAVYSIIYYVFPFADSVTTFSIVFLAYALPFALIEGSERALISDFVTPESRGHAFGIFHLVQGLGVLLGSAVFGLYYEKVSRMGAFHLAGGIAAVAAFMILLVAPSARSRETRPQ